jgi:hypothetical protein
MDLMISSRTTFADPLFLEVTPVYRVNFWELGPSDGWNLDAFRLIGASDVAEVMSWVEQCRRGRNIELFVEVHTDPATSMDIQRRSGLVRILGEDPDEGITVPFGNFVPEGGLQT